MPKKKSTANPNRIVDIHGRNFYHPSGSIGNGDTSYSYFNWGSEGYRFGTFQLSISNTTVTLEATNDDEDISDANAVWVDITNIMFGVMSFTSSTNIILDTPLTFNRLRWKRVTTNATNSFSCRQTAAN